MGFILSILSTKVIYGDYDKWTINDIYFVFVVGGFGIVGAWISSFFQKNNLLYNNII
jgi:hypothetical protein